MKTINQEQFLQHNIIEYDIVSSTMIVAKDFPENTVIVAQKQESGRGKGNRIWNSDNNNNLYFSLNINADKNHLDYSQLSFIASLAMRYSIKEYGNISLEMYLPPSFASTSLDNIFALLPVMSTLYPWFATLIANFSQSSTF